MELPMLKCKVIVTLSIYILLGQLKEDFNAALVQSTCAKTVLHLVPVKLLVMSK